MTRGVTTRLANIKRINEAQAEKAESVQRHKDGLISSANVQNTILSATASLIKYMQGHTTKTQVVNQLKHIGTPDAFKVVAAVNSLHETLKSKEIDLSPVTNVMQAVLDETKKIPKVHPKMPEQKFVDYSDKLKALESSVKAIVKAVKAQKLVVKSPDVNVPAPVVNVEAPDFKLIERGLRDILSATKANKPDKVVKTSSVDGLINAPFDEYKLIYRKDDDFNEDAEAVVEKAKYYNKGKLIATIKYTYDKEGNLTGGKRV